MKRFERQNIVTSSVAWSVFDFFSCEGLSYRAMPLQIHLKNKQGFIIHNL